MIRSLFISAATLGLISALPAGAATIFERDMPNVPFVNNSAGAARANYNYASPAPGFLVGDNFQTFLNGQTANSLTVYEISNGVDGTANNPTQEFSNITLAYGPEALLNQSTSAYTFTQFQYSGTTDYQSAGSGLFYDIYALTFQLPGGLPLTAGTVYGFSLTATGIGGNTLALAASDAALTVASGGIFNPTTTGGDGSFTYYDGAGNYLGYCGLAFGCSGDPVPTDINVVVSSGAGGSVPEPSSFGLMGLGAVLLGAYRARGRKV